MIRRLTLLLRRREKYPAPAGFAVLMETGDAILMETADKILTG